MSDDAARLAAFLLDLYALTSTTASGEPNAATSPTGSAATSASLTASGSASASVTPPPHQPKIAKLLPPMAGLPPEQPASDFKGKRTAGIPVLMYHVIDSAPMGARYPDLYVKPGEFVRQLGWLADNGYHAVTLQQVYDFWHNGGDLPSKPVVLSFDDGNSQDFRIVAPLLNELGWPGVLNLIVGKHTPRLKPSYVRALIQAGWEIDSHTISHIEVRGLSAKQLAFEVGQSRTRLQQTYHLPINFFCYPSGRYDDAAIAAVKKAGYLGATTTDPGLAKPDEPYLMRRIRVSGGESLESFALLFTEER